MKTRILYYSTLCIAAAALAWRLAAIETRLAAGADCAGCLAGAALASDAPFWLAWLAVTWLGFHVNSAWLGRALRAVAMLALLAYIVDVWVLEAFFTRLYLNWVVIYGARPLLTLQQAFATQPWWTIALAGLLVAWAGLIVWRRPRAGLGRGARIATAVLAVGLVPPLLAGGDLYYVHAWTTRNVLDANWFRGVSVPYSETYLERAMQDVPAEPLCVPGENRQRDVIVLILESWSSHHSPVWGGARDWTPQLDRIARKHSPYLRFIAGGFNTNHGLMSLLAGTPVLSSLSSPFTARGFEPSWGWPHTLPVQFDRAGYRTAFLTSGNLGFTGKDVWLRHLGFGYLEGHRHRFYRGHKRTHFRAAPDAVLYQRVVDYWRSQPEGAPQLIVVESVSSHTPFMHPLTRAPGEEGVIRYLDESASGFYQELVEAGFFAGGGLLVMVSDHRAMTAIPEDDFERFGAEAPARVPMVVAAGGGGAAVTRLAHQADLAPSIAALMTPEGCGFPGWRSLFDLPARGQGRCVFHTRGDDWGLVDVHCTTGHGTVRLDGDDSHFIEASDIPPAEQERVLQEIAVLRTMAHRHTRDYLER